MQALNLDKLQIARLLERVKDLEDHVFKKSKKKETTRAQQMLILKHLGILEFIEKYNLNKKSKAELLSVLLNSSADNIEDDLTNINSHNSPLISKKNYKFLENSFDKVGLKENKKECESILENLERKG